MEKTGIIGGKILDWKIGTKNLKIGEKTGIVSEKLLGWRIEKISSSKMDITNWKTQ